jgi:hypothetical protein
MTNIGTEATTSVITREFCDASAVQSEYAANIVEFTIDGRPVSLLLCGHHTAKHGAELVAAHGASISALPDIYAAPDASTETTADTADVSAFEHGRPPEPV